MNITIKPDAATDDAVQIDKIVEDINTSLTRLDDVIKDVIPEKLKTKWSETVRSNWETYFTADVPNALEAMGNSADNLRKAVDAALQYSRENM